MVKLCVPDMSARINETRKITWYKTCKCICRFTKAVCNDKQEWNKNKCRCECKEDLMDKLIWDKGYIWNPSTCTCECDRYCGTGQYLDYENSVCRKKIDYLIEQCSNIVDIETNNNTINNTINNSDNNVYFILFVIFLIIFLIICVLLIVGLIYYYRRDSNKKILNEMYNIVYSCDL